MPPFSVCAFSICPTQCESNHWMMRPRALIHSTRSFEPYARNHSAFARFTLLAFGFAARGIRCVDFGTRFEVSARE
jgi:hypothetical protein